MRVAAICMGLVIAFGALQGAAAVEPTKQDVQALAQLLKEKRQLLEKLSAHIKKLEQQLEEMQLAEKPDLHVIVYEVADLVTAPEFGAALPNFDQMVSDITTRVTPEHWKQAGGPGTVAPQRAVLVLVISATPEVHAEVSNHLARIRTVKKFREAIEELLDDFHSVNPQEAAAL